MESVFNIHFREISRLAGSHYMPKYLKYHNMEHALSVYDRAHEICSTMPDMDPYPILLAALWHDAVYIPGSEHNEEMSAQLMVSEYVNYLNENQVLPVIGGTVGVASHLIKHTTIKDHMSTSEVQELPLAILLDADLFSLSVDYEQFCVNQMNIISEQKCKELNYTARSQDIRLSANFLKNLSACRPNLYHTEYARKNWQENAMKNIDRWYEEAHASY